MLMSEQPMPETSKPGLGMLPVGGLESRALTLAGVVVSMPVMIVTATGAQDGDQLLNFNVSGVVESHRTGSHSSD